MPWEMRLWLLILTPVTPLLHGMSPNPSPTPYWKFLCGWLKAIATGYED